MSAERKNMPWNTPDFELRFREAMGRDMTHREREFFGLEDDNSKEDVKTGADTLPPSDRAEYAWQALRRITSLIG